MILHDAFTFVAIEQLIFQLQKIINNETKKKGKKYEIRNIHICIRCGILIFSLKKISYTVT